MNATSLASTEWAGFRAARSAGHASAGVTAVGEVDADGFTQVTLATGVGFSLHLPRPVPLPFRLHDTISVEWKITQVARSSVADALVRDAHGVVLFAIAGDGDTSFAGGVPIVRWDPTPLSGAGALRHGLRFGTVGCRADRWCGVAIGADSYAVSGLEVEWIGPRPPDGRDYRSWSIVRLP